MKAEKNVLSN